KAERYRLLNEPGEAESICRDILEVDPENQEALRSLALALTDQICDHPMAFRNAIATAASLKYEYDRAYYAGIAWERRAKAVHRLGSPGHVYDWIVRALGLFEDAGRVRPPDNDDALLRWNTCVRFLASHPELTPFPESEPQPIMSE